MKKVLSLVLLLVFVFSLAACSGQEDSQIEQPTNEAEEDPSSDDAAPEEGAPIAVPEEEMPESTDGEAPVELESGLAPVDSVTVSQQGGQYAAVINGNLPDSCTVIAGTSQSVVGSTITLTVGTQRPKDLMCAQVITPYSETVIIDTTGLEDGEYTVVSNGVVADQTVVVGETTAPAQGSEDVDASQIVNIVWQWFSVEEGQPAVEALVPNPENYTVTLLSDGTANIKADCNQLQVTYTLDGSSLVFNMLGPSTLAFCGEESLDSQFLALLGSVNLWSLENDELKMSTASGALMTFNSGGAPAGSVGLDPSQISLDTQGLPYSWKAVVVPLQPYDESQPPGPQGLPEHIEILFGVTDPAEREYSDPIMFIIPVKSYEAMYEANDNQSVTSSMDKIADLTYSLPNPAPTSGYPTLPQAPYSPVVGVNDIAVQLGRADTNDLSASKNGFRFVGRWGQSPNPVTNQNLWYTYQGFTNDGQYLVSFFYPVRTDALPEETASMTQEDQTAFNNDPMGQTDAAAAELNQLSASDWEPDLTTLDALVASLQIDAMVSSGVQDKQWEWTSAAVAGSEERAVESPSSYTVFYNVDGSFQFQADCNMGGGTYLTEGGFNGILSMQAGPMTAAACEPDSLADQYLDYLQAAQDYRLQPGGTILEMILPAAGGTVFFSEAGTAEVVLPEPESGEATGTVIAPDGANVRLGPSTNYPSIGVAPFGTTGTIIGVSQDRQWWAAETPNSSSLMGWILASLVQAENTDNLPVIPAPVLPTPTPAPTPVPPPSPTIKFWSDATLINEGECTSLYWEVENIQAVWVYPQGSNYQDYPVTGSGSQSVCPTQTTTYEMRVQHQDGSVEFRALTITVQPSNSLSNTSWLVTSLFINQVPLPGSSMTAFFSGSANYSGNGGCNTFNGPYFASGSSISIGPLAGTQMACTEALNGQEQAYLSAIQAARTFSITGSQLVLFDGSGQEVARLVFAG